jgi:hypothetical protein
LLKYNSQWCKAGALFEYGEWDLCRERNKKGGCFQDLLTVLQPAKCNGIIREKLRCVKSGALFTKKGQSFWYFSLCRFMEHVFHLLGIVAFSLELLYWSKTTAVLCSGVR